MRSLSWNSPVFFFIQDPYYAACNGVLSLFSSLGNHASFFLFLTQLLLTNSYAFHIMTSRPGWQDCCWTWRRHAQCHRLPNWELSCILVSRFPRSFQRQCGRSALTICKSSSCWAPSPAPSSSPASCTGGAPPKLTLLLSFSTETDVYSHWFSCLDLILDYWISICLLMVLCTHWTTNNNQQKNPLLCLWRLYKGWLSSLHVDARLGSSKFSPIFVSFLYRCLFFFLLFLPAICT